MSAMMMKKKWSVERGGLRCERVARTQHALEAPPEWRGTQTGAGRGRAARAFTLIELLLVLVILGILAAIVVPRIAGRGEQAKVTAARTNVNAIGTALDQFEVDNSRYPTTAEGLKALVERPGDLPNWNQTLKTMPEKDPWGNAYIYKSPGDHNTSGFDLSSAGPNGQEGDEDDVTNWK